MHIGLIGGIGPAATDFYYRGLISRAAKAGVDLELTIVHADAPTLIGHQQTNNVEAQCAIYRRLTERLAAAGAECVAITSIAGHFCIDQFEPISPLPVLNMMGAIKRALHDRGLDRLGLIGTKTVMETAMYGKLGGFQLLIPEGNNVDAVHEAYIELAVSGQTTRELTEVFLSAGHELTRRGAQAIMLGGTDLNLAFSGIDPGFAQIDCADIHIDDIATRI